MMSYVIVAVAAVVGVTAFAIAALSVRVLIGLVTKGPAAADEAFERGDSIKVWLDASQTASTLDSPRRSERLAFAGRSDRELGEVMVEERASFPTYA